MIKKLELPKWGSKYEEWKNRPISLYQTGLILGEWKRTGCSEKDLKNTLKEKFGKSDLCRLSCGEAETLISSIGVRDSSG